MAAQAVVYREYGQGKWLERGFDDQFRNRGRKAELQQLRRYLEIARTGKRLLDFVTGEPGIGKTTLVEAFSEILSGRRQSVIAATLLQ